MSTQVLSLTITYARPCCLESIGFPYTSHAMPPKSVIQALTAQPQEPEENRKEYNDKTLRARILIYASCLLRTRCRRKCDGVSSSLTKMLSDNGLQMVGAEDELRATIEGWDKNKLKEYCADRGVTWHAVQNTSAPPPPHLPKWMFCKIAIKKSIWDTLLTPFEPYTCLVEVTIVLNQHPFGKLSQNVGAYICPNDILLGRATNAVPQGPFRKTNNP